MMVLSMEFKVKPLVPGSAVGEILFTDKYLSFLGDVDQDSGVLLGLGRLKDKILVFPGSRGSTVGPYVIYSLVKRSLGPKAMIIRDVDPLLIVGSVLSNTPLALALDWDKLVTYIRERCISGCMGRLRDNLNVLEVT